MQERGWMWERKGESAFSWMSGKGKKPSGTQCTKNKANKGSSFLYKPCRQRANSSACSSPWVWSPELPSALSLPALSALSAFAISSSGSSSGHRSSFTSPELCKRDHGISGFICGFAASAMKMLGGRDWVCSLHSPTSVTAPTAAWKTDFSLISWAGCSGIWEGHPLSPDLQGREGRCDLHTFQLPFPIQHLFSS